MAINLTKKQVELLNLSKFLLKKLDIVQLIVKLLEV